MGEEKQSKASALLKRVHDEIVDDLDEDLVVGRRRRRGRISAVRAEISLKLYPINSWATNASR